MTPKLLLLTVLSIYIAVNVTAQKPGYPTRNTRGPIPFGKKLYPSAANPTDKMLMKPHGLKKVDLPYTTFDTVSKQFKEHTPGQNAIQYFSPQYSTTSSAGSANKSKGSSTGIHLTKDINTLSEGIPRNYPANSPASFAVLNNISYFFAEDGIHGRELWRSDGTSAGTYIVKDINPGTANSEGGGIIAAGGLLYFSASTATTGTESWVSDGSEQGTTLLRDLYPGSVGSYPNQFVDVNGIIFFSTSIYGSNNQLWKTDGSESGTVLVKDLQESGTYNILELTKANNLAYFIANTWNTGLQLFRSDGTNAGTYLVAETGYFGYGYEFSAPMQLTEYDNKLFFSVDDGGGRRLWTSDGTPDGTSYAPGNNEVFMRTDYMNIYKNFPFRIINNILYLSGKKTPYTELGELYKYDAANAEGIVLVKDLYDQSPGVALNYAVPVDMTVVNDHLIFKVISSFDGVHDEVWTSDGTTDQTKLIKTFPADAGVYVYNFYNADGSLYFVAHDNQYGNELWTSDGTDAGTFMVRDINAGSGGSYPEDLTFCNGKLIFSAFNKMSGNELWYATGAEASLLKDINTTSTGSSYAGSTFLYKGIGESANGVVFNAFTPDLGGELYKSDGTSAGTVLLNDIYPGENWSYPNNFIYKNNETYFINDNALGTVLYKTNGTPSGLKRIIPYINRDMYFVANYNITNDGLAVYTLGSRLSGALELWRSDGSEEGTYMLTANLSYYYNNYVATAAKLFFFIAGDFSTGYELWKSDGTVAGTKMVRDINPGSSGSDPYNLFVYKNEVYFGALDGTNYSLWKSDGSEKGTFKLRNVVPAFYNSNFNPEPQHVFCVSNGILYFSGDEWNAIGAELWKTNGTIAGTTLVKDVNPYYGSYPNHLTDVKGTLYFSADDGTHGYEIWKSNGTSKSTQLVKDILTDNSGYYFNFCSAGGKLYFLNGSSYPNILWSTDGTAENTSPVLDEGLNGLTSIENLFAAGDKLFFGAYTHLYGAELYQGNAITRKFGPVTSNASGLEPDSQAFDAILYPNPAKNTSLLVIKGSVLNVKVSITDLTGRMIWNIDGNNKSQIILPVQKLAAGEYIVLVVSGSDKKILKLIRE